MIFFIMNKDIFLIPNQSTIALHTFLKSANFIDFYFLIFYSFFCLFLTSLLLIISYLLSNTFFQNFFFSKNSPYECGFSPILLNTVYGYSLHYFRIALIFLIFDLEILILFPWISVSKFFLLEGYFVLFYSIFPFFFFLILSVFYEYIFNIASSNNKF